MRILYPQLSRQWEGGGGGGITKFVQGGKSLGAGPVLTNRDLKTHTDITLLLLFLFVHFKMPQKLYCQNILLCT